MPRAKIEVGLKLSFLVDIDYVPPDAAELDAANEIVSFELRDDVEEIAAAINRALEDDHRYLTIVSTLSSIPTGLRARFPDTPIDARLIPFVGLPNEAEI